MGIQGSKELKIKTLSYIDLSDILGDELYTQAKDLVFAPEMEGVSINIKTLYSSLLQNNLGGILELKILELLKEYIMFDLYVKIA